VSVDGRTVCPRRYHSRFMIDLELNATDPSTPDRPPGSERNSVGDEREAFPMTEAVLRHLFERLNESGAGYVVLRNFDALPRTLENDLDILIAPRPDPVEGLMAKISMCSAWTSINVLMLDERRVVVDRSQPTLIRRLREWGFDPITCPFLNFGPFGGSFHCATLDVRRRGTLQSYF
jgi:hypothetical protein